MKPLAFAFRAKRYIRQQIEIWLPKLAFRYRPAPPNPFARLRSFSRALSFLSDRDIICSLLENGEIERISVFADEILDHKFRLFGEETFQFDNEIDWHLDTKSELRWPHDRVFVHSPSSNVRGMSARFPWQLSRFHHGPVLALGYVISKDAKYIRELFAQILGWIDSNPVGYGINWSSSMEASIRAINWILSLALVTNPISELGCRDSAGEVIKALWLHGCYISKHLEWNGPFSNTGANHLLFDLAGLYSLGCFFSDTALGVKWSRSARRYLEREVRRQVLSDGVHFERSIYYHRFCLEALLWTKMIAERMDQPFSKEFYSRVSKMQHFVECYIKRSGIAPIIGDNDGGRLFSTGLITADDHSYLCSQVSGRGAFYLDRFLLDGSKSIRKPPFKYGMKTFRDGGYHFLWNANAEVVFRAGPLGYKGAHSHNDQLSFELSIGGLDVFVDRGTYIYKSSPACRNVFRSTLAHNVLQIDDLEQNSLGDNIFYLDDQTETEMVSSSSTHISAVHFGYMKDPGVNTDCSRRISLCDKHLEVEDRATPISNYAKLQWRFHLGPSLFATIRDDSVLVLSNWKHICILRPLFKCKLAVSHFPHSPFFGELRHACLIRVTTLSEERQEIYPFVISWPNGGI